MSKRRRDKAVILSALAVSAGFLMWLLWSAWSPHGSYRVKTAVPTAVSLGPGASVRIAGLDVGRVSSVERKAGMAILGLELDADHGPLAVDTRVAVRLRTLVGESYVEIHPGRSRHDLPEDALIPPSQVEDYVEVDQILDSLRGRTRQRARDLIQGLGGAVGGQGRNLNRLVAGVSRTFEEGGNTVVLLERDRKSIAQLVKNLGDVTAALAQRRDRIERLSDAGRQTFRSIAARDEAVRLMLSELPPTLDAVRRTAHTLRAASWRVGPLLRETGLLMRDLTPAVDLLAPAAREGRGVVRQLGRAAPGLARTLAEVRRLPRPTKRAFAPLREALCELNPAVEYLKPYGKEIAMVASHMGSTTNYYDATGHAGRLIALVTEDALSVFDKQTSDAAHTLLEAGLLQKISHQGYNPYPKAGAGTPPAEGRGVNGMSDAKRKLKYHRVKAEC